MIRQRPIRGESERDFLGEPEGSLPPPQDSFPDAGEAIHDFWSMSGNFIYRHHVEPSETLLAERRIIPFSTEVQRRLQNYTQIWMLSKSAASMIIAISMGQEICLIHGQVSLSILWSGRRLTRKQLTSRPYYLRLELWIKFGRTAELQEKQRWSIEKPKLDIARRLRGIYFIDPENKEFSQEIGNTNGSRYALQDKREE